MKIFQNDECSRVVGDDDSYALAYLMAVKVAFKDKSKRYREFSKLLTDYLQFRRRRSSSSPYYDDLLLNYVKAIVKEVLKGHRDLILGFNPLLPKEHQITLPFQLKTTGEKVKVEDNCLLEKKVKKIEENCLSKKKMKVEENRELPWDVLDIISKTLELDDHFQFAGVCKSWRAFHKIYWRNFLASQEPLLLQVSDHGKGSISFINIPDQKVYCLNTMKCSLDPYYVTSSSGYLIMVDSNKSFVLIDPFTRIKKVTKPFTFDFTPLSYHALLAFGKCSDEFVLVVLRKWTTNLHVYQSRNCGWVTYSTMGNLEKVIDFVVLHNEIYVVTDWPNIGILSLNSANIKFLKLNNTTDVKYPSNLKLVNCDEQLLVVNFSEKSFLDVYKVDFSTMNYVKLKTLGDIALFYALDRHCYSLSKPNMWGYESNSLYATNTYSTKYSGDDKKLEEYFTLPGHPGIGYVVHDWYFRHLKHEVDYSLVE